MKFYKGNIKEDKNKILKPIFNLAISNISILNIIIGAISFSLSAFLYYKGLNYVTSAILMCTALILFFINRMDKKYYTNVLGIFSVTWFFTIGLSALKLHQDQVDWKINTWICFALAYIMLNLGYFIREKTKRKKEINDKHKTINISKKRCLVLLTVLCCLVVMAFVVEIIIRKELPIFSNDMASYQNFAVSGIHMITVSSALILPATYIYGYIYKKEIKKCEIIFLILMGLVSVIIPFLIVSRHLMITTIAITALSAIVLNKKREILIVFIAFIAVILSWMSISEFRNQDVEYLEDALQMQEEKVMPVKEMQVYMYVAMNYDNFNVNVDKIENHTYGVEIFSPFIIGFQSTFVADRIIPVYNTYPIIMAPYIDFGIIGVIIYMLIIGYLCCIAEELEENNTMNIILKSLFKYALLFSFFNCLFANSTFIFYIILILVARTVLIWKKDMIKFRIRGR